MADCTFSIPFTGQPTEILAKAKEVIEKQEGTFNGDETSGSFSASAMGYSVTGSYTIIGNDLNLVINDKPFFIPCGAIEAMLRSKLA